MRYPEFLPEHGRIGFIAPSFGCDGGPYRSCFEAAIRRFEGRGYSCVLGPNCFASEGVGKSNTPERCGAEINAFFTEDRSDIILSCGGGETMCEDLPFVDFPAIAAAKPKWFMGYSDNTNLTFTLPTLCDTAAVYGPCAASFGQQPLHPALEDALRVLTGEELSVHNYDLWEREKIKDEEHPYAPYNCTEPFSLRIAGDPAGETVFSGRLLGGCLDILQLLCGTPWDKVRQFNERYRTDGTLWFLESCDLNVMSVTRGLWQLKQAGWFDTATGFLIGRPLQYDDEAFGVDRYSAVTRILEDLGVPIVMDVDIGHLPPSMPLISGAVAEVHACPGSVNIQQKLL